MHLGIKIPEMKESCCTIIYITEYVLTADYFLQFCSFTISLNKMAILHLKFKIRLLDSWTQKCNQNN